MHIPPYIKKRSWQLFLLGIFTGSIIAYLILIFMYGKMYANLLTETIELRAENQQLVRQNEALLRDKEKLEQENEWFIQSIDVRFTNSNEFRFDKLTTHQLSSQIKDELQDTIGKDVKTVAENSDLIESLIEKSTFEVDDLAYAFVVKKMVFSEQMVLELEIKFAP